MPEKANITPWDSASPKREEAKTVVTATDKKDIISNILAEGFDIKSGRLIEEDVSKAEVLARDILNSDQQFNGDIERKPFENKEYFKTLKGLTPSQIRDRLVEESPYDMSNVEDFVTKMNQAGVSPYQAKVTKLTPEGDIEWGWHNKVDSYQLSQDPQGTPLYYRFYKDGSYDLLDKRTFDREKHFNRLPDRLKQKVAMPVRHI